MLCYLDRTFCSSDCVNRECPRNITPEHVQRAKVLDLLFSISNLREGCKDYKPPESKR